MDVCGVDYLEHGRAEWKTQTPRRRGSAAASRARRPRSSMRPVAAGRRFAVVYHLLSISLNQRLRLRVFCADDAEPMVDSVTGIWAASIVRARPSTCSAFCSKATRTCAACSPTTGSSAPVSQGFPSLGNVEVRYDPEKGRVVYQPVSIDPRCSVPKVIRHDNRYDPALTNAPVAAAGKPMPEDSQLHDELRTPASGRACVLRLV